MESVDILLSGWYKLKYTFWVPCLCVNCRPASISSPMTRTRSSSLGSSSDPPPLSPSAALDLETPTNRPNKPLPALPKRSPTASTLVTSPVIAAPIIVTPPPGKPAAPPSSTSTSTTATTPRALPQVPPTRSLSADAPSSGSAGAPVRSLSAEPPSTQDRTSRQQTFKKAFTVFELAQHSTTQASQEAPASLPQKALDLSMPTKHFNRPTTMVVAPGRAKGTQEAPASLPSPRTRAARPFTAVLSPSTNGVHSRPTGSVAPIRGALSPFQQSPAPPAPSAPSAKTVTRSVTHASLQVGPSSSSSRPITPPPPTRRLTPPATRPSTPPTPSTPEKQPPVPLPRQLPPQPQKGAPPPPRPPPPPPPVKSRPKLPPSQQHRRASDTPESPRNRPRTGSLEDIPSVIMEVPSIAINNEPVPKPRTPSPTHSSSSSVVKKRNLVSRFLSTSVVDTQANIAEAEKV